MTSQKVCIKFLEVHIFLSVVGKFFFNKQNMEKFFNLKHLQQNKITIKRIKFTTKVIMTVIKQNTSVFKYWRECTRTQAALLHAASMQNRFYYQQSIKRI